MPAAGRAERPAAASAPAVLPSGARLRARILAASALLSLGGVVLISLYLVALLRLPPEQWRGFAWIVGGLFPLLFAAQAWLHGGLWLPITAALDRRADGSAIPAELRAGFAGVANLPGAMLARGGAWWVAGGCLVAAGMRLRFAEFSWLSGAIMLAGAASGGFVTMVFHFLLVKRMLEPARSALAAEAGGPDERAALVRRVPLAAKLLRPAASASPRSSCSSIRRRAKPPASRRRSSAPSPARPRWATPPASIRRSSRRGARCPTDARSSHGRRARGSPARRARAVRSSLCSWWYRRGWRWDCRGCWRGT